MERQSDQPVQKPARRVKDVVTKSATEMRLAMDEGLRKTQNEMMKTKRRAAFKTYLEMDNVFSSSVSGVSGVSGDGLSPTATADSVIAASPVEDTDVEGDLFSENSDAVLKAIRLHRRRLSLEDRRPIEEFVTNGYHIRAIELMDCVAHPQIQIEAAWCLTNICSLDTDYTKACMDAGIVSALVKYGMGDNWPLVEQCLWCIGNIAGDRADIRNALYDMNGIEPMLRVCELFASGQLNNEQALSMIRYSCWGLSNFVRNDGDTTICMRTIHAMKPILFCQDEAVLADCIWALAYTMDSSHRNCLNHINEVIREGLPARIIELLKSNEHSVQSAALRACGNIVAGDDQQTDLMLKLGLIKSLGRCLYSSKKIVRKEACWVISNVCAGNTTQLDQVLDSGLMNHIASMMQTQDFDVRRECAWCVSNAASGGNYEQVHRLVECNVIQPLVAMLDVSDHRFISVALEAVENILGHGNQKQTFCSLSRNPYLDDFEAAGLFNRLEKLQYATRSQVIGGRASRLIEIYLENNNNESTISFGGL